MTDFLTIDNYLFKFGNYPHCERFSKALNDMYSEPFEDTTVASLFTDVGCTAVATDAIAIIQAAVINIIDATSLANHAFIAPIINTLILSTVAAIPPQQFPLRTAGTVWNALIATVNSNWTTLIVTLNTVSLYVDCSRFNVIDFTGLSLTGPVHHIHAPTAPAPGVVGAGAGATAGATQLTAAQVVAADAAVTANAANQALITQQAAAPAAAALAATLPTKFNLNNLPPKVKAQYENHLDTSYLMTKTDM